MKNKSYGEVIDFYSSLNRGWLDAAIDSEINNIPTLNRTKRRELKKSKNYRLKITPIIFCSGSRKNFAQNIYEHYKDKNPLDGVTDYSKIIESFNVDTAEMYTAYMLYVCFSVEGYQDAFFEKFAASDEFMNTVLNRWSIPVQKETPKISENEEHSVNDNNTNNDEINKLSDNEQIPNSEENTINTDSESFANDYIEQIAFSDDDFEILNSENKSNNLSELTENQVENNIDSQNNEVVDSDYSTTEPADESNNQTAEEIIGTENNSQDANSNKDTHKASQPIADITITVKNSQDGDLNKPTSNASQAVEEITASESDLRDEDVNEPSSDGSQTTAKTIVTENISPDENSSENISEAAQAPLETIEASVTDTDENVALESDEKTSEISAEKTAPVPAEETVIPQQPHKPRYIGFISLMNTFYNFYPQYVLDYNKAYMIDNPEHEFPEKKNINLFYTKSSNAHEFLKKNYDINSAMVVEFDKEDMEPNYKPNSGDLNQTNYKLDTETLVNDKMIGTPHEYGAYKIVSPKHSVDFYQSITVKEYCRNGEMVFMRYKDRYYGPCEAQRFGNISQINFDLKKNRYILQYFQDSDRYKSFDLLSLELSEYYRYIYILPGCKPQNEDVISDEILLDEFSTLLKRKHNKSSINLSDIGTLSAENTSSPFFAKCPEDIRKTRLQRLSELMRTRMEFEDEISDILVNWVQHDFDSLKPIFDAALSPTKENIIYFTLREQNDRIENELKALRDENKELIKLHEDSNNSAIIERELDKKIQHKNDELAQLTEQYGHLKHITDIDNEIKQAEKSLENYRRKIAAEEERLVTVQSRIKNISSDVAQAINKSRDAAVIAFEPMIANKLLESAAQWDRDDYEAILSQTVKAINSITPDYMTPNELIDYICGSVRSYRNYSRNCILNIIICITQGFLTVFSGEPGIGKTSICNIIANVLGLTQFSRLITVNEENINVDRYIPVAVEKGWTSKRDFIGYYNPLTKKFDAANNEVYQGFRLLDREIVNNTDVSKYPFIMLLDEANLSQMEYYWADFMSMADNDSRQIMKLNLGANITAKIPRTLRFVATINNDQTSESMSPRLLDRAWMIYLPEADLDDTDSPVLKSFQPRMVAWEDLNNTFGEYANIGRRIEQVETLKKIYECFENHNVHISFRTKKSIDSYIKTAQSVFTDEPDKPDKSFVAIDYAVVQKLLPKLNAYNNKALLSALDKLCKDDENVRNLEITSKYISDTLKSIEYNDFSLFN